MEEEKIVLPKATPYKRKLRSWSDDPNTHMLAFTRAKTSLEDLIQCSKLSLSTVQFHRPFEGFIDRSVAVRADQKFELRQTKHFLIPMDIASFPISYKRYIEAILLIMGKNKQPEKKKDKKRKTGYEEKLEIIENYFFKKCQDFVFIAKEVNLTRQNVRKLFLKFQTHGSLFEDHRGNLKKLNQTHIEFMQKYLTSTENFGNSMFDLHEALIKHFDLDEKFISIWFLYNYMKGMKFSHKKIVYKVEKANTNRIKDLRIEASLLILTALQKGFEFYYIDEVSFNLELRPGLGDFFSKNIVVPRVTRPGLGYVTRETEK